jgi:hypothetical protein
MGLYRTTHLCYFYDDGAERFTLPSRAVRATYGVLARNTVEPFPFLLSQFVIQEVEASAKVVMSMMADAGPSPQIHR